METEKKEPVALGVDDLENITGGASLLAPYMQKIENLVMAYEKECFKLIRTLGSAAAERQKSQIYDNCRQYIDSIEQEILQDTGIVFHYKF